MPMSYRPSRTSRRQCPSCYQHLLVLDDLIDEHLRQRTIGDRLITVRCGGSGTQLRKRMA